MARAAARSMADSHPEITGNLLFGSVLRGDAVPGSDVDLLVVLRDSDRSFLDRLSIYTSTLTGLDMDVFPYTEDEVLDMLETRHALVADVLREGEWLLRPPEVLVASQANGADSLP